jgi:hypothetical protein
MIRCAASSCWLAIFLLTDVLILRSPISPGEELPPIEALGEAIEAELNYRWESQPLQVEADRLLQIWPRPEAEQRRLDEIAEKLARLSADRPQKFGGRFSAEDVFAMNIIRDAAKVTE